MKTQLISFLLLLILISFSSGCNKDEIAQAQNARSQICSQINGVEAVYWDIFNGIPRGDIPGGLPTIKDIGGNYIHPAYPPLGFIYPAGWTPQTISDAQSLGVNLLRNDNQGIWRWMGATINGFLNVNDAMNFEVGQLLNFFGNPANVQTVCANNNTSSPAPGILINTSSALIRAGGTTASFNVSVTTMDGLPSSFLNVQVTAGPTVDYPQHILDVYLPIGFQMLYGNNTLQDSDNDGTPDVNDNFPFDPTKQ